MRQTQPGMNQASFLEIFIRGFGADDDGECQSGEAESRCPRGGPTARPGQTFLCLQKAYEGRFTDILSLKVDADLDPLRSDPRFQELMRRVGLP